jgi:SAM-dependent methyltransferase
MRCPVCGFLQVADVGDGELAGFYEQDYFEGKLAHGFGSADVLETDTISQPLSAPVEWLIARYLDPLRPSSVLEIGPGMGGGWIKRFRGGGNRRLQCVEVSALASERLNAAGIPTFNGVVEEFDTEKPFDLALAIEVIEHVADPVAFARKLGALLTPGGHLFLSTGNTRSGTARRAGLEWYYLDPPAHLSYFDDHNIVRLLRDAGFDEVEVVRVGFKWVELALKYHITAALPLFSALNYASGMLVLARRSGVTAEQAG